MKIFDAIKAASRAAALAMKATYTTVRVLGSDWFGSMTSGWGALSFDRLARLAMENPYAGRGLRLIAQASAAAPIAVYRQTTDEAGKPAEEAVGDHALAAVLARPYLDGRRATWRKLIDAFVWGIYCGGDFYLERRGPTSGPNAGRARELHVLRNSRFLRYERDEQTDMVTGYVFSSRLGKERAVPAEDVLHVYVYDPLSEEGGMPLLVAGRRALTMMEQADDWNRGIAKGGGRVPGYFAPRQAGQGPPVMLSPEQVKAAQANIDETVAERRASNLPMVLSGAFDYVGGAVTPKEADWLKGQQKSAREVAAVLGVPATLLADEKSGSLTDAGVDSEMRALLLLTCLPMLGWLLEELSEWLLPEGERLGYDRDQIEVLQEDVNGMFERYGKAATLYRIVTDDEARTALGYDPFTDEQREQLATRTPATPPMPPAAAAADAERPPPAPPSGAEDEDKGDEESGRAVIKLLTSASGDDFDRILREVAA